MCLLSELGLPRLYWNVYIKCVATPYYREPHAVSHFLFCQDCCSINVVTYRSAVDCYYDVSANRYRPSVNCHQLVSPSQACPLCWTTTNYAGNQDPAGFVKVHSLSNARCHVDSADAQCLGFLFYLNCHRVAANIGKRVPYRAKQYRKGQSGAYGSVHAINLIQEDNNFLVRASRILVDSCRFCNQTWPPRSEERRVGKECRS